MIYQCGYAGYACLDPSQQDLPSPAPTEQHSAAPTLAPLVSLGELETTALALCLIALVVGLGLSACYCQNPDAPGGGSGQNTGGPSRCPTWPAWPSSSGGGPKRGKHSGKFSRMGADEAKQIELARFARMSERSDAYPSPNGSSNPLSGAWSPASSAASGKEFGLV